MSVFIIAEAGINHCGSMGYAEKMIEVAAEAGADAIKFQSYDVDKLGYQDAELNALLTDCRLQPYEHTQLKQACDAAGIEFMSTPFDIEWAKFLHSIGVKRMKISSGKAHAGGFVAAVRALGLPLIISNGMADEATFRDNTQPRDTVLYCVSQYPAPLHKVDLSRMAKLRHSYYSVGYSDHTASGEASVLAAAMGATVIERHFTLDRTLPGPDQICSSEPAELRAIIEGVRNVG